MLRHEPRMLAGAAILAMLAAGPPSALAQDDSQSSGQSDETTWVDITTWDAAYLYDGWSAKALLDQNVYGEEGNVIGEVEDFFVGRDGMLKRVVVEGGGFWDIGDSHIAAPVDQMSVIGTSSITLPVREGDFESLGPNVDDELAPQDQFRVNELIGDYLTLDDGSTYGYVRDVIFGSDNKIEAIVAAPMGMYERGWRAVPYPTGGTYDPALPSYRTPYSAEQVEGTPLFNYGDMSTSWRQPNDQTDANAG